ncbi:hypothetical protein Nepgr_005834 [Nepenthes gracilis]|uniref:F-box domain-containing protein n=1 Tax=Nepenthes gracilis TaxID=150966 RepID=A0AAD3S480_NEPGR|nr:hypothetical protein Nepgr_005834 [Nepenthes gracilis]
MAMKRSISTSDDIADKKLKKVKLEDEEEEEERGSEAGSVNLDDNLLFEVLKHVDARTLAVAACVSKLWHKTAQDERLWELICTRHWSNIGCGTQQLRSVVLALGGFRRLHSSYLWPLSKPSAPTPTPFSMITPKSNFRWGKDEVHLSLSLLSIRYFEKMNFTGRGN